MLNELEYAYTHTKLFLHIMLIVDIILKQILSNHFVVLTIYIQMILSNLIILTGCVLLNLIII